jgi:hypothetical protein
MLTMYPVGNFDAWLFLHVNVEAVKSDLRTASDYS